MKITFIGATHEVTGSCTLLEVCGKNILVDCGMEQGADIFENIEIPVAPSDIDAIVATHAHIDHTGKLPFLVAHGYKGPIYSTRATEELCSIMLMDSAHIQEQEAQWKNRKAQRSGDDESVPLYTSEDVINTMKLFSSMGYGTEAEIFEGVTISYTDAGHLLGSSNVLFRINEDGTERTILFSGDIGNLDKPLIRSPQTPPHADYVVCESTYGDRLHSEKPDYLGTITEVIQTTLDRGGNVVVPSFAVGRTQELLYYLRIIKEQGLVKNHPDFPVYVDSPLAVEATNIYSTELYEYYDDEAIELLRSGVNPVTFPDLMLAVSSDESKAINEDRVPKVILSASGMCEAGRIRHHLKHNLWRPESTILFVGYQSKGTVGAKLLEGAETVRLFGEDIQVRAEIRKVDSFSSHADMKALLKWISDVDPTTQIFINHGEDEVTESFAMEAAKRTGKPAVAPYSGEVWNLADCSLAKKAEIVPVIRKSTLSGSEDGGREYKVTESTAKAQAAYRALQQTGYEIEELIRGSQGVSNKQLIAFNRDLRELLEKYSK